MELFFYLLLVLLRIFLSVVVSPFAVEWFPCSLLFYPIFFLLSIVYIRSMAPDCLAFFSFCILIPTSSHFFFFYLSLKNSSPFLILLPLLYYSLLGVGIPPNDLVGARSFSYTSNILYSLSSNISRLRNDAPFPPTQQFVAYSVRRLSYLCSFFLLLRSFK